MTRGCQDDNPRIELGRRRCQQRILEMMEKRKVAEVVDAEVLLEAVLRFVFGVASYSLKTVSQEGAQSHMGCGEGETNQHS